MLFKNTFIAGWGRMSLEDPKIESIISHKPITVIEENGFYSYLSMRDGVEHLAPFVKGVLTGIFDTLRRIEHTCEMEIISETPLKCRYTISPL